MRLNPLLAPQFAPPAGEGIAITAKARRRSSGLLAIPVLVMLVAATASAEQIAGKAEAIDGDTLKVAGVKVRLWGIDAPEGRQECVRGGKAWSPGPEATETLRTLILQSQVTCEPKAKNDRNGRMVALCRVNGLDIGAELVRLGWALNYPNYSRGFYAKPEAEARGARRGVWSGKCSPPWEWRAERR